MINGGVVARNKLQQRLIDNVHEHLAPDPFAQQTAPCTIIKVFDAETIQEEGISVELGGLINTHPGWLFAQVLLQDQRTLLILPFKESEEFIYAVYGNRVQLEGRAATICYVNQDPQNGCIKIERTHNHTHLPLGTLSQIYDIGVIV